MSGFSFVTLIVVTLICNLLFCIMTNDMSQSTIGRGLKKSSWAIWIVVPTLIQIVLVDHFFHPITYLILMVFVLVMICLTVRQPKVEQEDATAQTKITETPFSRLGSWLIFAIPIEAALIFSSATLADKTPGVAWALNHGGTVKRNFMACLTPFIIVAAIGLFKAITVSNNEKETTTTTTMATDDLEDISSDEAAMAS